MALKEDPDCWARLRFTIIGHLLTAPPPRGKLRGELKALAQKSWLRRDELLPLGSRIRTRLIMEYASRDELANCLDHLQSSAGNARLMTTELATTLCDHAVGNYRVLTGMAGELLATAAQRELTQLDEKLFLELYGNTPSKSRQTA